jgi:glutathione S-transferase
MELFAHPFSSYSQKALIALYEHDQPFTYRLLEQDDPATLAEHRRLWRLAKMPLLRDGDAVLVETSVIVEYVDRKAARAGASARRLLPGDPDAALRVRMLDRVFDNYVMTPMQKIVADALRPSASRDPFGVDEARSMLASAYAWLDGELRDGEWAAGEFSLADCAAAPSLFYADWVEPIPDTFATLRAYRARVLARPSVARCVDEARPYRHFFPPGAPDRD